MPFDTTAIAPWLLSRRCNAVLRVREINWLMKHVAPRASIGSHLGDKRKGGGSSEIR
jgi:hypothetical protein